MPSFGQDYFFITVSNEGVGPAIIDDMRYIYNDSIFYRIQNIADYLIEEVQSDTTFQKENFSWSNLESPGQP